MNKCNEIIANGGEIINRGWVIDVQLDHEKCEEIEETGRYEELACGSMGVMVETDNFMDGLLEMTIDDLDLSVRK